MHSVEADFPILGDTVGVLQIQRSRPDGFDFRTEQFDPRLKAVLYKVVMVGLSVLRGNLDPLFIRQVVPPPFQKQHII